MWEELHKAWENDVRQIWVVNVGDIKPMEIGIDYFSKFAWHVESFGPDSQPRFLHAFAAKQFGEEFAKPISSLLTDFYRLGTVRKPELMNREWALSLADTPAAQLRHDYQKLLDDESKLASSIPANAQDAYFEMIGFPARVLGGAGLIFMADRAAQFDKTAETVASIEITKLRAFLQAQVDQFNKVTAGGKWKFMMPGLTAGLNDDLTAWHSQVCWPWGEKPDSVIPPKPNEDTTHIWRDAATADRQLTTDTAKWTRVDGLGHSGHALVLKPAGLKSSWKPGEPTAPTLVYNFKSNVKGSELLIDFMPTFRLYPGTLLRVNVSIDDQAPVLLEVPGSNGKDDENGPTRRDGIQNNYVRARMPLADLEAGEHILKISAVDPGAVIDRVGFPNK
jgi:hypothetical protein